LPEQYARQVDRAMQMGLSEVFGDPIDKAKWAAEMPMGIVRNAGKDAFKSLRIYFDAGTDDRYGFAPPNEELAKLMTDRGIAHTFELVQGGGHSWGSGSLQKQLVKSLQFVGEALSGKAAKLDDVTNGKSADGAAPASGKGK
jgi:S-formylglutathione hydrolase FrmB